MTFPYPTRVLIVDNDPRNRRRIKRAFTDLGYTNIMEAISGTDAWHKIQDTTYLGVPYELITSQTHLDDTCATELLQQIRQNKATRSVPFIFLLAPADSRSPHSLSPKNISATLYLPININALKDTLATLYQVARQKEAA